MIGSLPKGYCLSWFKVTALSGQEEGSVCVCVRALAWLVVGRAGGVELNLYDAGPRSFGDTAEGQHQFLAHQPSNFSPFHTCCSK